MKKLLAVLMSLVLLVTAAAAVAEEETLPETGELYGMLTDVTWHGFVLCDDKGNETEVWTNQDTLINSELDVPLTGMFLKVFYAGCKDGIPLADSIYSYEMIGTFVDMVYEIGEDSRTPEATYLVVQPLGEEQVVWVAMNPETIDLMPIPVPGATVRVWYDGMMTRSDPAKLNAIAVETLTVQGVIESVGEDGALLIERGADVEPVIVFVTDETIVQGSIEAGDAVTVVVGPTMTMSIPAQYTALAILGEMMDAAE